MAATVFLLSIGPVVINFVRQHALYNSTVHQLIALILRRHFTGLPSRLTAGEIAWGWTIYLRLSLSGKSLSGILVPKLTPHAISRRMIVVFVQTSARH